MLTRHPVIPFNALGDGRCTAQKTIHALCIPIAVCGQWLADCFGETGIGDDEEGMQAEVLSPVEGRKFVAGPQAARETAAMPVRTRGRRFSTLTKTALLGPWCGLLKRFLNHKKRGNVGEAKSMPGDN